MKKEESTNALIHERSPYLQLHAHNPVNWLPWGDAAFEKAAQEDKPVFLSIGYTACHWCHVMEKESFCDPETAEVLNRQFVSVKVDREERPDVDEVYMTAVQMLTGSGGWPLSVFLTPDRVPFYGGTYFPPDDRQGMPSFRRVLLSVAQAWRDRRGDVANSSKTILDALRATLENPPAGATGTTATAAALQDLAASAVLRLGNHYDKEWGGFGFAPKFPPAGSLLFLTRHAARCNDAKAMDMVHNTLHRMAWGGLFDQIGGGFHRYAVDREWAVPHFEKMLYDNALLARVYAEAWQVSRLPLYRRVVEATLDFVGQELTDPASGMFLASLDADTDEGEGHFYTWTPSEVEQAVGKDEAGFFSGYFGVDENGPVDGRCVLRVNADPRTLAQARGCSEDELQSHVEQLSLKARKARQDRKRPAADDKAIACWNGLMISAFAHAYQCFGRAADLRAALRAGMSFRKECERLGWLPHVHQQGESRIHGFLDDYAAMASAFLDLYETTFDTEWLRAAIRLLEQILELFQEPASGALYQGSRRHADLPLRTRSHADGSTPSGSALALLALTRAAALTGQPAFRKASGALTESAWAFAQEQPTAAMFSILALQLALDPVEIALVGGYESESAARLLHAIRSVYLPQKVTAFLDPSDADADKIRSLIPMLQGREASEAAAAFVCRQGACRNPMTDAGDLASLLRSVSRD